MSIVEPCVCIAAQEQAAAADRAESTEADFDRDDHCRSCLCGKACRGSSPVSSRDCCAQRIASSQPGSDIIWFMKPKCQDGVVLGADTRATNDTVVADKNCEKIHYIADNIYCCGAGTAADTENTAGMIASQLELHRLATQRQPRVATALTMLKQYLFKCVFSLSASAALVFTAISACVCVCVKSVSPSVRQSVSQSVSPSVCQSEISVTTYRLFLLPLCRHGDETGTKATSAPRLCSAVWIVTGQVCIPSSRTGRPTSCHL